MPKQDKEQPRRRYFIFFMILVLGIGEYITSLAFDFFRIIPQEFLTIFKVYLWTIPFLIFFVHIYGLKKYSRALSYLYVCTMTSFALLMCMLAEAVILTTLYVIRPDWPIHTIGVALLDLAVFYVAYGTWGARNIKIKKYTISSKALAPAWKGKKIVVISDTHFGLVWQKKTARKIVGLINEQHPNIVFHAGDIIDGPIFPYEETFSELSHIESNLGVFYTEGNHEHYSPEYNVFRSHFPKHITDLTDQHAIINDTQVIGLSFRQKESAHSTEERLLAQNFNATMPSIILLHAPFNVQTLADQGVSLVISGHTHAGQFFPFTLVTQRLYGKFNYSINYLGTTVALTTSGTGTAVIPIRVSARPEIVVLTIE
jgi:predicted MPP superfamily phosphohydrolase